MTDQTVTDLLRELEKAREALSAAELHLARHAEANAALHCAETVMYSPLHAKVQNALYGIAHALMRTRPDRVPDGKWAALLADLDRCMHGRHQDDPCAGCLNGRSTGNPRLLTGTFIGYDRYGDHIVMPDRDDKHDPAAWRQAAPRSDLGAGA